jgi:ADP-heptose:LPS heptosyltransferase
MTDTSENQDRILVIKLGSLGDFVQAMGPMAAIRRHHPAADITLLTTAPYVSFGQACGYFDHIMTDTRPRWNDLKGWLALRRKFNDGQYTRVYDLQNSDRSRIYFRLFSPRPEWVGTARGASHRNASAERTKGSPFSGHRQTLALAGIEDVPIDPMLWIRGDLSGFGIGNRPYVLLVPGSSPHLTMKRWPAERYGELARRLFTWGYLPIVIGTLSERDAADGIRHVCPDALDLTGQTTLTDIVLLGRKAAAAIGNDTGPLHMIGPTGCPTLALFSGHSDGRKYAPLGPHVEMIQTDDLSPLDVDTVATMLTTRVLRQTGDSIVFAARPEL